MSNWSYDAQGPEDGRTLVFLHGFLGAGSDYATLVADLSSEYRCIVPELPGHAGEALEPEASFGSLISGLVDFLEQFEAPHLLGYSLGGRLALATALEHPRICKSIVLISATAGIMSEDARVKRIAEDEARARQIETQGLKSFLEQWYSLSVFSSLERKPELKRELVEKRVVMGEERAAASLRAFGPGRQKSYWEVLHQLEAKALLVNGAEDKKFVALARSMKERIGGNAQCDVMLRASHMVHLERRAALTKAIRQFHSECAAAA